MVRNIELERRLEQIKESGVPYVMVVGNIGPNASMPETLEVAEPELVGFLGDLPETVDLGPSEYIEKVYGWYLGEEEQWNKFLEMLVKAGGGRKDIKEKLEDELESWSETHYIYDPSIGYTHIFLLPSRELVYGFPKMIEMERRVSTR